MNRMNVVIMGISLGMSLIPSIVWACAVCYGSSDSNQIQAVMWGMWVLLGIVMSVFLGIAAFFWNMRMRTQSKISLPIH